MAQIPKNLPPTAPTTVSSGRLHGGLRTVASLDASPVEETSSIDQDGVLFNDALLYQRDDQTDQRRGNNQQAVNIIEHAGSSQTFATIFENSDATSGDVQRARSKGFANLVSRAINTYENNVRIIHGTGDPRGSNLSMTL